MVDNHSDSKSPKDRVVGPLPNGLKDLEMGVTNHLLTGMILQVSPMRSTDSEGSMVSFTEA